MVWWSSDRENGVKQKIGLPTPSIPLAQHQDGPFADTRLSYSTERNGDERKKKTIHIENETRVKAKKAHRQNRNTLSYLCCKAMLLLLLHEMEGTARERVRAQKNPSRSERLLISSKSWKTVCQRVCPGGAKCQENKGCPPGSANENETPRSEIKRQQRQARRRTSLSPFACVLRHTRARACECVYEGQRSLRGKEPSSSGPSSHYKITSIFNHHYRATVVVLLSAIIVNFCCLGVAAYRWTLSISSEEGTKRGKGKKRRRNSNETHRKKEANHPPIHHESLVPVGSYRLPHTHCVAAHRHCIRSGGSVSTACTTRFFAGRHYQ